MNEDQWGKLQEIVRKGRHDPLMSPRFLAIEVARTGILPPSFEDGSVIRVPSFTKQDVWYTISENKCNCAASEYGARCCHPHYHAACMRGHHPAVRIEEPLTSLRGGKSRMFLRITGAKCVACDRAIGSGCAMIHHMETGTIGVYHMNCWHEMVG